MTRSALIYGASGLVGGHLLKLLLEDDAYSQVTAVVRCPLETRHERLKEASFDAVPPAEDVFCCLGTTIKKAGSREAFRRIDQGTITAAARGAAKNGAKRFCLVSSVGASANSSNFYLKVKGEIDRDVQAAGIPAVHIFHPSLLLGKRVKEIRLGERIAVAFSGLMSLASIGPLRGFHPISAKTVASAMKNAARSDAGGVYEYADILKLAGKN